MLKFKFLLWTMTKLLQRAIKTNPACAKYVAGEELEFQIQTLDRWAPLPHQERQGEFYRRTHQGSEIHHDFQRCRQGLRILSAKDGKEAFLAALHDEDLVISGDFVEVMWFQGLTEYLQPAK